MAKRTRVTTSVSTLVSQIHDLRVIAKVSGRKDLSREFGILAERINKLVTEYTAIRSEIDPFVKLMLTNVDLSTEEEVEEEVDA